MLLLLLLDDAVFEVTFDSNLALGFLAALMFWIFVQIRFQRCVVLKDIFEQTPCFRRVKRMFRFQALAFSVHGDNEDQSVCGCTHPQLQNRAEASPPSRSAC